MMRLHSFVLVAVLSMVSSSRGTVSSDYAAFREKFRPAETRDQDAVPLKIRQQLFEARTTEVDAHNAQPHTSWVATVNHFADFTEAELAAMRGYQRSGGRWSSTAPMEPRQSSFLEAGPDRAASESVDWREQLPHSSSEPFKRQQGSCGSCWAVAAVGVMEMHAELAGARTEPLSYEQLVDCVPNPRRCGGEGGCRGATAELGFGYVAEHGLARAEDYRGYASGGDGTCRPPSTPAVRIASYVTLPVNRLAPLQRALSAHGPVVASVDASGWFIYHSGVFDSCSPDAIVNHAVIMLGYGSDEEQGKYYLIRNSWGPRWGEAGYLRLRRHDADEGAEGFCGVDRDPKKGVGCDGGPAEIPVCGMCGVLSDSAYPEGVGAL